MVLIAVPSWLFEYWCPRKFMDVVRFYRSVATAHIADAYVALNFRTSGQEASWSFKHNVGCCAHTQLQLGLNWDTLHLAASAGISEIIQ